MTALQARCITISKMVGFLVEVRALGDGRPEDDPRQTNGLATRVQLYVPLPEYGVALWLRGAPPDDEPDSAERQSDPEIEE